MPFGPDAAGWTVRVVTFGPTWAGDYQTIDPAGTVWNGSAFVADSFANRTLGGFAATESLVVPGTFSFTFPIGILTTGNYPMIAYHQLGGSFDSQNDDHATAPGSVCELTLTTSNLTYAHYFPYTEADPVASETEFQDVQTVIGEGRNCIFFPVASGTLEPEVPSPLANSAHWKVIVRGFGLLSDLVYTVANGKLSVDTVGGRIVADVTTAQTSTFKRSRNGYYELWRIGPDDDSTLCIQRVKSRTND